MRHVYGLIRSSPQRKDVKIRDQKRVYDNYISNEKNKYVDFGETSFTIDKVQSKHQDINANQDTPKR